MNIGFTGSRTEMSPKQLAVLREMLQGAIARAAVGEYVTLHHGDCIGSDAQANLLAKRLGMWIVIHPPSNPHKRAFCTTLDYGEIREQKDYIARNHDIVDECDMLFATPSGPEDKQPRSGTWATVRYARQQNKHNTVIMPDGTTADWVPSAKF